MRKSKRKSEGYGKYVLPIVIIAAVIIVLVFIFNGGGRSSMAGIDITNIEIDSEDIKTLPDGTKYIVDPSLIRGGGPPKDGIPSIDNPKFVSVEEANDWIQDNALVLALEYKSVERVYPLQIMIWHEIVNDVVAGDPLLITYCPLCGSGIAYERTIAGQEVEFGTSGKLYNSNLVMYDRATDTYWTQIGGKAILGDLTGLELKGISLDTVEWGMWKAVHPDTEVLSTNTGFARDYTNVDGPYANYFANDFYLFPGIQNEDNSGRLQNKEFVFGIEIDGEFKAYPKKAVEKERVIEDTFNGVNLRVEQQDDGKVVITNIDTGEEIVKEVDFWFAWFAFHPDTELYGF